MTLPLTPDTLRAAYDFLAATPPFCRWNLPDSEDVVFKVVKTRSAYGWHCQQGEKHVIGVSSRVVGHTATLLSTMAHELIHLHQGDVKMDRPGVEHNAAFRKLAERVCRYHGFDPKAF